MKMIMNSQALLFPHIDGVAMGNAIEKVKNVADMVTPPMKKTVSQRSWKSYRSSCGRYCGGFIVLENGECIIPVF